MGKVKCIISYDGTEFAGFQVQPEQRTVQGEFEKALKKMHKGTFIRIHPSGRTDSGVHAVKQVIHFESFLHLQTENWLNALNTLLPDDLVVKDVQLVDDLFHARYSAVEKEYRYYVFPSEVKNVFKRHYVYQFKYPLVIESMQEACRYLEGTHDFTTFSSAKSTIKGSKVRTLKQVTCQKKADYIEFIFRGNGFLYNMVRIIIGTLLEVGQGRRRPEEIHTLLTKRDRRLLGRTAPPQGLYLWDVIYEKNK